MKLFTPAFTLLELLVSVAVIALLGGLILPAVQAARNSGAAARSAAQLRQLATANLSYLSDNGTFAPGRDRAKAVVANMRVEERLGTFAGRAGRKLSPGVPPM